MTDPDPLAGKTEFFSKWHHSAPTELTENNTFWKYRDDGTALHMREDQYLEWCNHPESKQRLNRLVDGTAVQIEEETMDMYRTQNPNTEISGDRGNNSKLAIDDSHPRSTIRALEAAAKKVTGVKNSDNSTTITQDISNDNRSVTSKLNGEAIKFREEVIDSYCRKSLPRWADPKSRRGRKRCHSGKCSCGRDLNPSPMPPGPTKELIDWLAKISGTSPAYLPPCYCGWCSGIVWPDNSFEIFNGVIPHDKAAAQAIQWISETIQSLKELKSLHSTYNKSIQKRWHKSTLSERRRLLNLSGNNPLSHNAFFTDLGMTNPITAILATEQERPTKEQDFRLSAIIPEDLAKQNAFLRILEARIGTHPSQHLLQDLIKLKALSPYVPELRLSYIYGTFATTEDQFGTWHIWNDDAVHNFTHVAAPVAYAIFESQYLLSKMLLTTVRGLLTGLNMDNSVSTSGQAFTGIPITSIPTPSLANCESLFMMLQTPKIDMTVIVRFIERHIADKFSHIVQLRSDNKYFISHCDSVDSWLRGSWDSLPNPSATSAYYTLLEPYERLSSWVFFLSICNRYTQDQSNIANTFEKRRTLCTLRRTLQKRSEQIAMMVMQVFDDCDDFKALLPSTLRVGTRTRTAWMRDGIFGYPARPRMVTALGLIQKTFESNQRDVEHINGVLQQLIVDALVINRVLEALVIYQPGRASAIFETEAYVHDEWDELFPHSDPPAIAKHIRRSGRAVQSAIQPVQQYKMPSGPQGKEWNAQCQKASTALRKTWAAADTFIRSHYGDSRMDEILLELTAPELPEQVKDHVDTKPSTPQPKKIDTAYQSSIPHDGGLPSPVARKITNKKLQDMNSTSIDEQIACAIATPSSAEVEEARITPPKVVQIEIRRSHLAIVDALFSKVPDRSDNVRWPKFVNFMHDAGCSHDLAEGSAFSFTITNVHGTRAKCNIHRPHPEDTLKVGHLRVIARSLRTHFGWEHHMFVVRKGDDEDVHKMIQNLKMT